MPASTQTREVILSLLPHPVQRRGRVHRLSGGGHPLAQDPRLIQQRSLPLGIDLALPLALQLFQAPQIL